MTKTSSSTRTPKVVGRALLISGLAIGLTPVLGASPAYACSCLPADPAELRKNADVVFKGNVKKAAGKVDAPGNTGAETVLYTFRPTRTYKGRVRVPEKVSTAGSSATCGVRLKVGATYMVYANKERPENNTKQARREANRKPLTIGLCGGTHQV